MCLVHYIEQAQKIHYFVNRTTLVMLNDSDSPKEQVHLFEQWNKEVAM